VMTSRGATVSIDPATRVQIGSAGAGGIGKRGPANNGAMGVARTIYDVP
jgi:hypothetical protein